MEMNLLKVCSIKNIVNFGTNTAYRSKTFFLKCKIYKYFEQSKLHENQKKFSFLSRKISLIVTISLSNFKPIRRFSCSKKSHYSFSLLP